VDAVQPVELAEPLLEVTGVATPTAASDEAGEHAT
jgi:hypothetical protein